MTNLIRKDRLFPGLAFLLPLLLYVRTLCPTVPVGDGGELICAAHSLGIAHPTGYPLYCLLGRIFSMSIPAASVAVRINFMSAVFGALSAMMVYFLVQQFCSHRVGSEQTPVALSALTAALLFAFSRTLWSQAVQSEVYTLHTFLVALLLLLVVHWYRSANVTYAYLGAFVWGLSLANHTSAIFLAGAAVFGLVWRWPYLKSGRHLGTMALFFLLGISLYLYLPVRSVLDPPHDWGNPETWKRLWEHVTARQYHRYFLLGSPVDVWRNIRLFVSALIAQWHPAFIILGLAGAVVQLRCLGRLFVLFLLAFLANILLAVSYGIPDIEAYFLPAYLIFAMWMGLGLVAILRWLWSRWAGRLIFILTMAFLMALILVPLVQNFAAASQRGRWIARDYGLNILNSVEADAILFVAADNEAFPTLYLHDIEGVRSDVEVFDLAAAVERMRHFLGLEESEGIDNPGELRRRIADTTSRPVCFVKEHVSMATDPLMIRDQVLEPYGLVYRLRRWPQPVESTPAFWDHYGGMDFSTWGGVWDYKTLMIVANVHLCKGEDLWAGGDSTAGRQAFAAARDVIGKVDRAQIHNSMGVFFRRMGWLRGARLEFEQALRCSHRTRKEESDVLVNLSNLYADTGRIDLARAQIQRAQQVWPENPVARFNLARLEANQYLLQGQYDRAAEQYERMLAIDPTNAVLCYNLGLIYAHRLQNHARAIECFHRYLELAPEGPQSRSAVMELEYLEGKMN